jgi:uncharacterized protein YqhQ
VRLIISPRGKLLKVGELETQEVAEADSLILLNISIITILILPVTYAKTWLTYYPILLASISTNLKQNQLFRLRRVECVIYFRILLNDCSFCL